MGDQLIFILAGLTLLAFFVNLLVNGHSVRSCILFTLTALPLMNLKITSEAYGGFKIFDFIWFYALVMLLKEFVTFDRKQREEVYVPLFFGLIITLILSGLSSEFPERTWFSLLKFVPIFIYGRFLLVSCMRDSDLYWAVVRSLKISYLIAIGFLGIQVIFGLGFTFYPSLGPNTIDPVFKMVRYPGVFYDSQIHGQYLAMGSFLFLYMKTGTTKKVMRLHYAVFLFSIVAMVLAGSRAPVGGFLVGLLVVVFVLGGKYRLYVSGFAAAALAVYLLVLPQTGIFQRAGNVGEDFQFRKSLWDEAYGIFTDNPLIGIGAGNYQDHVMRHLQNQYLEIEEGVLLYFDQPENGYLKILVELGLFGFLFFIIMLAYPLIMAARRFFQNVLEQKAILLIGPILTWMVAFNTVYSLYDYRIMITVATLLMLILAYPKKNENESYT